MTSIWDFWAKVYDHLWVQKVSLQPTRDLVNGHLFEIARRKGKPTILDVGCGTGQQYGDLVRELGADAFNYTGFDLSAAMIDKARGKFPEGDFRVSHVEGFTNAQPWDAIICSHSFPYYENGEAAFGEMAEWLAPGGVLLLSQACEDCWYDTLILKGVAMTTSRARYRSRAEMEQLGSQLFRLTGVTRINPRFFMPSLYLFRWQR